MTDLLDPAPRDAQPYDVDDFGTEAEVTLYYGNVDEFVRDFLRHMYKRRVDGRNRVWSARWWSYGEAIARLEALWRSWEYLRQDPSTGMSVWWRDHADYHMPVLLDPDGVFADTADDPANTNRRGEPLPYAAPPEGMFPDVRSRPL
ncbi:DUF4913 domain-containing protein [Microlunatus sp. Gsoil 973]|uniref:DUF4913 domain-containing protein n=1 Tax=Microlunatus sp. Gsoil 973 TaxID=2672569 RepID=UPI0012B4EDB4|nr:DUF4913 domain-containing protein [Microlunatus sp. Gsoil 973]QGN34294.1 DUF4913 domain-containing protein [Microlunatus sp. Gsoil 973]